MIELGRGVVIPEAELRESFFQSAGPGGQNVNKVATAVRLCFDLAHSPSLPSLWRERLQEKLSARLDGRGVLSVVSRKYRTQAANREAALLRLAELLQSNLSVPARRRPTRPTKASVTRRLEGKKQHSDIKKGRTGNWNAE